MDLKHGLLRLGENLDNKKIDQMFNSLDGNKNGFIEFE
jgi:Ca2+-binding EF-hand superfamily protein